MKKEHQANKHLTYDERNYIEIGLNKGKNFTQIEYFRLYYFWKKFQQIN